MGSVRVARAHVGTMGGPMSGSRAPLAPEKGVFPLDHFGECKKAMRAYLACLRKHGDDAATCREVSKKYLECRMDRELMAKQPLEELGFGEGNDANRGRDASDRASRRASGGNSGGSGTTTSGSQRGEPARGFVGGVKSAKAFTRSRTGTGGESS